MLKKLVLFNIKGMNRDLAVSKFSPEYSYENKNIRLTPIDDNTLLGISPEKGNSILNMKDDNNILGNIIGECTINDNLILFSAGGVEYDIPDIADTIEEYLDIPDYTEEITLAEDTDDRIYRIDFSGKIPNKKLLYKGQLNFNINNPIESIGVYETESIQKVYWVDGINLLRFINIMNTYQSDKTFNVIPKINTDLKVNIKKYAAGGLFPSGVIQYAFSYYNKNGEETNLVYLSPIEYISKDIGVSPENNCTNSFELTLKNLDTSFQFIRIYSIIRTSLNATVESKIVKDIEISGLSEISFIDDGAVGRSIDTSIILFLNKPEIHPRTLTSKDNTLFIGNLELQKTNLRIDTNKFKYNIIPETKSEGIEVNNNNKGQLLYNQSNISTFKCGDYYLLGLLFKNSKGVLSEVVPLKSIKLNINNTITKLEDGKYIFKPINIHFSLGADLIPLLISQLEDFKDVRLVMAKPNIFTRRVLGQGILCPTVFKMSDRIDNSPFAQASWIMRGAGHHLELLESSRTSYGEILSMQYSHKSSLELLDFKYVESKNIKLFVSFFDTEYTYLTNIAYRRVTYKYKLEYSIDEYYEKEEHDIIYPDSILNREPIYNRIVDSLKLKLSYEHWKLIPSQSDWESSSGETAIIITNSLLVPTIEFAIKESKDNYYTDDSILTFNSPELENFQSILNKETKLRIIGYLNIDEEVSNYLIDSGPLRGLNSLGEVKNSFKSLKSNLLWNDVIELDGKESLYLFATYMWHRSGSLNADGKNIDGKFERKSILKKKIFLNSRIANNNFYLLEAWNDIPNNIKISSLNFVLAVLLPNLKYSELEDSLYYYGNIDSIISGIDDYNIFGYKLSGGASSEDTIQEFPLKKEFTYYENIINEGKQIVGNDPISIKYKTSPHAIILLSQDAQTDTQTVLPLNYRKDYSKGFNLWDKRGKESLFIDSYGTLDPNVISISKEAIYYYNTATKVLYKRLADTTFIPMSLEERNNYKYAIMSPDGIEYFLYQIENLDIKTILSIKNNIKCDTINFPTETPLNIYYIAELYKDDIDPYKDYTKEDYKQVEWIPISDFKEVIERIPLDLYGDKGDTYYLRWDCLKTYPFTNEDPNQVIDITSFMVESHINLDGRYDIKRYKDLTINNTNFNKLNPVYSQLDNFFTFNITDLKDTYFPNLIMWSRPKYSAEEVDTWTNINPTNLLQLDGDKGEIQSLNRVNNEIYAFLDKGICRIMYNSRAAIAPSDGVPIEIANSGKVEGKVYITDKNGCSNKWSIVETPRGLYFADSYNKSIMILNGLGVVSLSDNKGMNSWCKLNINKDKWNPSSFSNLRSTYNQVSGDVYFTTKDVALAFNEKIEEFTSFYSYGKVPWIINMKGKSYLIKDNALWEMFSGNYCSFFGYNKELYIDLIANPDFNIDKVFENIEFRTNDDTIIEYNKARYYPFLRIDVWNEYLKGKGDYTSLLKKFRTWRWQLPRNNASSIFSRDRIRNPWTHIKITRDKYNSDNPINVYDLVLSYYI